jgi:hypothetical protein
MCSIVLVPGSAAVLGIFSHTTSYWDTDEADQVKEFGPIISLLLPIAPYGDDILKNY